MLCIIVGHVYCLFLEPEIFVQGALWNEKSTPEIRDPEARRLVQDKTEVEAVPEELLYGPSYYLHG